MISEMIVMMTLTCSVRGRTGIGVPVGIPEGEAKIIGYCREWDGMG